MYYKEYDHFRALAALFYSSNRTVESYFWEARRLLGHGHLSPRQAFMRAVAGQPPRGYERVVLEQGRRPPSSWTACGRWKPSVWHVAPS